MATKVITRIKFHYGGFNRFRKQPAVGAELMRRGENIALIASQNPGDVIAIQENSGSRARVIVITATPRGIHGEAKDRRLTRALDAGRR